jgi:cytochrome c oxidase accessory protein FixG
VTGSPADHWAAFVVVAVVTALMFLDFGVLREQVCLFACPYGRFQSVLLDRRSLIVGYDAKRGEPRGLLSIRQNGEGHGDCIDCGACVITCPTGIDIRDGLQMECIHCTQCADACDRVMAKIGKPRGLIRYGSEDELEGKPRRILRPRVVLYPLLIAVVWGSLAWALTHRGAADVTVLRGLGSPVAILPDGRVSNQLRVKVVNRADGDRAYAISLAASPDLELVSPDNPLAVAAGKSGTATVFVTGPRSAFPGGERPVNLVVDDGSGFRGLFAYELVGPEDAR